MEIESQVEVKRDKTISHYRYAIRSPVSRNIIRVSGEVTVRELPPEDAFPSFEADVLSGIHIKKGEPFVTSS
jgi:hypothetical protein